MFVRSLSLMILAASLVTGADTILKDEVRLGVKLRTIQLSSATPFTATALERLSRLELSRSNAQRIAQIRFYGNKGGEPLPKLPHYAFSDWRRVYEITSREPIEIAELIKIDGNAVLRLRRASGEVEKRVLTGKDPLVQQIRGAAYEVVYLATEALGNDGLFRLYVRTNSPLRVENGTELLARMNGIVSQPLRAELYIRNDAWFIEEMGYPISNPFINNDPLPNGEDYGKTLYCSRICWPNEP